MRKDYDFSNARKNPYPRSSSAKLPFALTPILLSTLSESPLRPRSHTKSW